MQKRKAKRAAKPAKPILNGIKRTARKAPVALRNAPQFVAAIVILIAVETITALGIFQVVKGKADLFGHPVEKAPVLAIVSLGCALLALVGKMKAKVQAADPRPEIRAMAKASVFWSDAVLAVTIFFLACSFAYDAQHAAWEAKIANKATYERVLQDYDPLSEASVDALAAYDEPLQVNYLSAQFVLALIAAILLHRVPMQAAASAWTPKPETEAQANRRAAEEKARRSAATRAANKAAKAAEEAAAYKEANGGRFPALFGGKRA